MYYLENGAQPDQFPNIIASFWWAVTTLTTVGYGDVYPVTVGGKILAGVIALLGIGLVALPAGIVSSGFLEEMQNRKAKAKTAVQLCPHCGKRIRVRR
jgi:voltage-gated potassium channel